MSIFADSIKKQLKWNYKLQCTGETHGYIYNKERACFDLQKITIENLYKISALDDYYFFKCPSCGCFTIITESSILNEQARIRAFKIAGPGTMWYSRLSEKEKEISREIFD